MNNIKEIALFLFMMTFGGMLLSQEAPAPIVIRPSDPMAWKITLLPPTDPPDRKQQASVSVDHILSGGLMKIVVSYEDGTRQEYWKVEQVVLSHIGKSPEIQAFSGDLPRYPYAARGFYGIENIKPEHAKGISRWSGLPCQYYQGKRAISPLESQILSRDNQSIPEIQYEAWFDLHSGLPIAYRTEGKTWIFEFSSTPPPRLSLPGEWQAALDKYRLDLRRAGLAR